MFFKSLGSHYDKYRETSFIEIQNPSFDFASVFLRSILLDIEQYVTLQNHKLQRFREN